MKISEMQLYSALNEFIDRSILPLGASMNLTDQFLFGIKIGIIKRKIQDVVKSVLQKDEVKTFGLLDEHGNIDVDILYQSAMESMSKMQKLELAGITFKSDDIQKLYDIIKRYSV